MQLVFVNATKIWSGVKTWILTLGQAMVRRGHQVSIVAYPGVFVDVCRQRGLEVLPLRFGPDGNPWVIWRLLRWFAAHNADCIVTNIDKDIYVAGLAARCAGTHVVNHVGMPREVMPGGKKAFLRARLIDLFHFPSNWALRVAQDNAPWLHQHQTAVLYYPIDVDRFAPRPTHHACRASLWRIGITGRLVRRKGHHTLIEALRLLPPDVLDNVRVEIAGAGPLEGELRAMVQAADLTNAVHFVGFLTDPERFLQQLDIAVFPSLSDSFCLAVAEAMACALPVVASAVDGIPEVVTHAKSGLLIPPENPHRLAEALTQLCRDPMQRETLGRNARQEVVQKFAVATIAEQFESLLEKRVLRRGCYL
jgi:glycosyltransferase involved in cell wall biosynthesis